MEANLTKLDTAILTAISNATSPILSHKDLKMPSVHHTQLKAAIRRLRDEGRIVTSNRGYTLPKTDAGGEKKLRGAALKSKRASSPKPSIKCLCGCGEDTAPGSVFRMGHDARLKGRVIRVNAGAPAKDASEKVHAAFTDDLAGLQFAIKWGAVTKSGDDYALLLAADLKARALKLATNA